MNNKVILDIINKHVKPNDEKKVGNNRQLITLSVPDDVKADFDKLQMASDKQFVKAVKEVVMKTIELGKTKIAV